MLKTLLYIALLQTGPQALPAARTLVVASGLAYLLVGAALLPGQPPARALLQALADTLILAGFTRGVLQASGRLPRFLQTFTALAGTGALLGLAGLPLIHLMAARPAPPSPDPALIPLAGLLLWSLLVLGHVWHHALDTTRGRGVLCGLGYVALSVAALSLLFPAESV